MLEIVSKWFRNPKYLLIAVIFAGAVFRLWGLGSAEVFHDEGAYAFRVIGYLDFISNDNQTTPIQWYRAEKLPAWTHLSMHDHPPLYFFIAHIFTVIFGGSLWALRLPSALFGIASIYLIYILARKLTRDEYAAIFAAAVLAVNHMHIWISRSILMESVLIFFILLAIYAFIGFLDDRRRWLIFGLALGLAALTKYTAVFLAPTFLIYVLVFRREIFKWREAYYALALALVMLSPVIIYNLFLYKAVGHFDLQISYLFGQNTPEWTASFGKLQEPFSALGRNLVDMYSIVFLMANLAALGYAFFYFWKNRTGIWLIFPLMMVFVTLVLTGTGSAQRFIALYLVPAVPLIALAAAQNIKKWGHDLAFRAGVAAFLIFEIVFTINGIFLTFPDFGAVKLDAYLEQATGGKASAAPPESPNKHLDDIIKYYYARVPRGPKPILMIYDENISLPQRLWLFGRRTFYKGITTMSTRLFQNFISSKGSDILRGYDVYFVRATQYTALNPYFGTNDAEDFERYLTEALKIAPAKVITGYDNLLMFRVYKFTL